MIFFPSPIINKNHPALIKAATKAQASPPAAPQPEVVAPSNISTEQTPSLPSMTQMAKNISNSLLQVAKGAIQGHGIKLTQEEASQRFAICNGCQYFRKIDQRCSQCGCYMAVKTYLRATSCPVGKW